MTQAHFVTRRTAMAGAVGAFAVLATGCSRRGSLLALPGGGGQGFGGATMGTTYTVKLGGPALSPVALATAQRAVAGALADVVARMSHYETGSELSRLNRQPLGRPLAVSEPTARVFEAAQAVHLASAGAFDVAVGRAVDGWGFGPAGRTSRPPDAAALAELRRARRPGSLGVDGRAGTVTRQADVRADLSGVAKGYGVDRAASALEALGLGDYMVEAGGEIRTLGRNARGVPWQLAIELPDATSQRPLRIVPLSGLSLATSGDYRNFFVHEGRRYSHEIDPATAAPVAHALASVSVVAHSCMLADAWSTALFVLGPLRGRQTAAQLGLAAHFVLRTDAGALQEYTTAAFDRLGGHPA